MIRKITKQDKETYIKLASEFYKTDAVLHDIPGEHFEATFQELMRSEEYAAAYIMEYEGKVAGYALLAKTFSQEAGGVVWWIEELYVLEQYRSVGIGREFFDFLENTKDESVKRIRLEVEDYNTRAIALYKKMGFEPLEYIQMIKE
ncbi:MAG: GNAT family N-acetyltransferase [bacterium]|nr:GNAT family N-acetyltransferase [bacterium]